MTNRLQEILDHKRTEIARILPRMEHLRAAALQRNDFHGLALVVIKSMDMPPGSDILLTADAEGLAPATVKIGTPGYINKPDSGWLRHTPPQANPSSKSP